MAQIAISLFNLPILVYKSKANAKNVLSNVKSPNVEYQIRERDPTHTSTDKLIVTGKLKTEFGLVGVEFLSGFAKPNHPQFFFFFSVFSDSGSL